MPDDKKERDLTSERRKSSVQEERKRSRRLFGGILSALSQTAPSGQQKRRQEIEKRQAEKAKQQKVDDEDQRAERLARLKATRKAEQIKYNRESVSILPIQSPIAQSSNELPADAITTLEYTLQG